MAKLQCLWEAHIYAAASYINADAAAYFCDRHMLNCTAKQCENNITQCTEEKQKVLYGLCDNAH